MTGVGQGFSPFVTLNQAPEIQAYRGSFRSLG
jgi:hypothetical protein